MDELLDAIVGPSPTPEDGADNPLPVKPTAFEPADNPGGPCIGVDVTPDLSDGGLLIVGDFGFGF